MNYPPDDHDQEQAPVPQKPPKPPQKVSKMVWIAFISALSLVWLISRPNKEIARIHAARVRPARTKIPFQVGALLLLNCPIKVERCLTCGALHRKSEVALPINGPMQRIYSLGRGFERDRATQGSISLALH